MAVREVEMTYDREADAAYIYVQSRDRGKAVARNRVCNIELEMAAITVDFDAEGRVMGFELLGASRLLPSNY